MSVRRSSRIKRLEIDDTTRQKILFQPGQPDPRSIHSGKIRDLPYSRTNGVNRLLRGSQDQCQPKNIRPENGGSPLRSAIGKFTDKLQEAIKGIFPFKLFSNISEPTEPTEPTRPVEQSRSAEQMRLSEPVRSSENIMSVDRLRPSEQMRHSRSIEVVSQEDEKEARRQAYSELSAFFTAKRGQQVGPSDLSKVSHLFPAGSPIKSTISPRVGSSGVIGGGVLMTPLPRRMAADLNNQQQSSISRMPSVQRIAPPPTTALKFRTRVPASTFPHIVERSIVDEDVHAELAKSSHDFTSHDVTSPVKQSPMKIDSETKMSQEPSPKKEKRDKSTPNRFIGLFYLDPDEEEEELLRQDLAAQEQQKRIGTLAAKKEQRERKIAFRVTSEDKEEVKPEKPGASAKSAPLFDFGPSLTSTPRKEEEKPLINLATPVKTAMAFDLPSSTTKIGSTDDDRESKRKRPAEKTESLFAQPSIKPVFNFAPPEPKQQDKPAEPSHVEPPKFTFATPDEAEKPSLTLSFAPAVASKEQPAAPSFTFPTKPVESTHSETKFTFGAPIESKPAFTLPTPTTTEAAKPTFSFAPLEVKQSETNGTKPTFTFPGLATTEKPATSSDKPLFSFGPASEKPAASLAEKPAPSSGSATDKPAPAFGSATGKPVPTFTFGSAAPTAPEKSTPPVFSFGTPASATPATTSSPFTFGQQPKEAEQAKAPTFNFAPPAASSSEPKPFTFGQSKPIDNSKPSFGESAFGSASTSAFGSSTATAFGSAPTTAFGSTPSAFSFPAQQQQGGMDMQMEEDGMAQPAPMSAFGTASSSSFGFAPATTTGTSGAAKPFSFATGPSPAPSSVTTPTFNFTSPSPTNQFTFGTTAPVPATSPFTFGQPAQAQQAQPFVFGAQPASEGASGMDALASAAASGGGFNVGAGGSVTGARKTGPMTRARRR